MAAAGDPDDAGSQAGEVSHREIEFDPEVFRDPGYGENADELLEHALKYAQRFMEIKSIIRRAETQYREIAANEAWQEHLVGEDEQEVYEEDILDAGEALSYFDDRMREKLDELEVFPGGVSPGRTTPLPRCTRASWPTAGCTASP